MVAFAGSCVGLLLFLWISFGGTIPLAPQGYRLNAEFNDAVELGTQADVEISGVTVGKVVSVSLDRRTGLTRAVMELQSQYAPRPADTRAILRAKSLLGETYIELTPGTQNGPKLRDGATLPRAQISPTVDLDQILSTFDPATRKAFMTWMQQDAIALTGRGEDFNAALYQLYPFATNVDSVLAVLRNDSDATSTLLRTGGQVFSALSSSPTQLQGLIRNSNAVFSATAARDVALANTVRALPPFLTATRSTINRLARFSKTTKPLIDELRPAAVRLTPALQAVAVLAPKLRELFTNIGPLTAASKTGVPAFKQFLSDSVPLLQRLKPYLGNLVPVIDYINSYRREIAGFFANSAATTEATQPNRELHGALHYLRLSSPVNPEVLTNYPTRLESNRANPYMQPGGYSRLRKGLDVFANNLCTDHPQPSIGPNIPSSITIAGYVGSIPIPKILKSVYFTATPGGPPCRPQGPLGAATTGQPQAFPQLKPLP